METRESIITKATELFTTYGIKRITMEEIAKNLGISKRTIYENFKDKDEVLKSVLEQMAQEGRTRQQEKLSSSTNVIESILRITRLTLKQMRQINPAFIMDIQRFYPKLNRQFKEQREREVQDQIHVLFRKGVNEGLFRKDINLDIASRLMYQQSQVIMDKQIFPPDQYLWSEVFETMVLNFTRGMCTEKGAQLLEHYLSQEE